jgi:hypothetical protein
MLLLRLNYKEYLKLLNRLYLYNLVWVSLRFSLTALFIALSSSCTIIFYSGNIREIILNRSANETNSQDIIGILLKVVFNTNNKLE